MNLSENNRRSLEILGAYGRQGLHELGTVLYGPGTAAQHPEYGMVGTRPPGLVTDGLRPDREGEPSKDDAAPSVMDEPLKQEAPSVLDERLQQAEAATRDVRERDSREPERE